MSSMQDMNWSKAFDNGTNVGLRRSYTYRLIPFPSSYNANRRRSFTHALRAHSPMSLMRSSAATIAEKKSPSLSFAASMASSASCA